VEVESKEEEEEESASIAESGGWGLEKSLVVLHRRHFSFAIGIGINDMYLPVSSCRFLDPSHNNRSDF
jgi:hypothetical protein